MSITTSQWTPSCSMTPCLESCHSCAADQVCTIDTYTYNAQCVPAPPTTAPTPRPAPAPTIWMDKLSVGDIVMFRALASGSVCGTKRVCIKDISQSKHLKHDVCDESYRTHWKVVVKDNQRFKFQNIQSEKYLYVDKGDHIGNYDYRLKSDGDDVSDAGWFYFARSGVTYGNIWDKVFMKSEIIFESDEGHVTDVNTGCVGMDYRDNCDNKVKIKEQYCRDDPSSSDLHSINKYKVSWKSNVEPEDAVSTNVWSSNRYQLQFNWIYFIGLMVVVVVVVLWIVIVLSALRRRMRYKNYDKLSIDFEK